MGLAWPRISATLSLKICYVRRHLGQIRNKKQVIRQTERPSDQLELEQADSISILKTKKQTPLERDLTTGTSVFLTIYQAKKLLSLLFVTFIRVGRGEKKNLQCCPNLATVFLISSLCGFLISLD